MISDHLLDTEKMVFLLSSKGPLAKIFSSFEERDGQKDLIKKISECFNAGEIGVFEAETGVGKSLAYLLPSILWALNHEVRVIISTATINLQQQLIEKDAPLALKILGLPENFLEKIVLVKGRGNFLCHRRFYSFIEQGELFENDTKILEKLKRYLATDTFLGSKDELDFFVPTTMWSNICSESDNCLSTRCPFFDTCYVMKMKKRSENAKVLISNHHLLFNDLLAKFESGNFEASAVLPSFKNVVLDEAHGIEEAARSGFSESVNNFFLKKQLNTLYHRKVNKGVGVLINMLALSSRSDLFAETVQLVLKVATEFTSLENCALSLIPNEYTWSFLQSNEKDTEKLKNFLNNFVVTIHALNKNLSIMIQNIPIKDDEDYENEDDILLYSANVLLQRLKDIQVFFEQFEDAKNQDEYVFWFEKRKSNSTDFVQFYKTPIILDRFMQSALFKPMESVICTSATLQISGNFDFIFKNLGLKNFTQKKINVGTFLSPFPYEKNVLLNIPTDAPFPNDEKFNDYICKSVLQLIQAGNGRALVLFTSYNMLQAVSEYVKQNLKTDYQIYAQGEKERAKLLSIFKAEIKSCLFATESFWTGVDVPGEALSHLILVKLPFEVPSHPVVFAKSRFIELSGSKPFFELSIPHAVIKFKQGFGRLIRSKSDKGVITILDNRLLKKNYGGIFLKSIPKAKTNFDKTTKIILATKNFFAQDQ